VLIGDLTNIATNIPAMIIINPKRTMAEINHLLFIIEFKSSLNPELG
jgi:hypothetical protein